MALPAPAKKRAVGPRSSPARIMTAPGLEEQQPATLHRIMQALQEQHPCATELLDALKAAAHDASSPIVLWCRILSCTTCLYTRLSSSCRQTAADVRAQERCLAACKTVLPLAVEALTSTLHGMHSHQGTSTPVRGHPGQQQACTCSPPAPQPLLLHPTDSAVLTKSLCSTIASPEPAAPQTCSACAPPHPALKRKRCGTPVAPAGSEPATTINLLLGALKGLAEMGWYDRTCYSALLAALLPPHTERIDSRAASTVLMCCAIVGHIDAHVLHLIERITAHEGLSSWAWSDLARALHAWAIFQGRQVGAEGALVCATGQSLHHDACITSLPQSLFGVLNPSLTLRLALRLFAEVDRRPYTPGTKSKGKPMVGLGGPEGGQGSPHKGKRPGVAKTKGGGPSRVDLHRLFTALLELQALCGPAIRHSSPHAAPAAPASANPQQQQRQQQQPMALQPPSPPPPAANPTPPLSNSAQSQQQPFVFSAQPTQQPPGGTAQHKQRLVQKRRRQACSTQQGSGKRQQQGLKGGRPRPRPAPSSSLTNKPAAACQSQPVCQPQPQHHVSQPLPQQLQPQHQRISYTCTAPPPLSLTSRVWAAAQRVHLATTQRHKRAHQAKDTTPSHFQQSVYNALCGMGYSSVEMEALTPDMRFCVDILITHRTPDGVPFQVAVEVDGPTHYMLRPCAHAPTGKALLRNRQLCRSVGALVVVPYFEWQGLRTQAAQAEYLRGLMGRALPGASCVAQ